MPESTCAAPLPIRPAPPSGPLEQGREFAWTQADFARVQALIRQRAGISLHDGKHAMVYSRLSRRLRDTGHRSFHDYLAWLQTHDGPEWQEFVNALTTNLTAFFREQHHFGILAAHLRAKSAAASAPAPNWRLWCSAASTGEEPYSIAMTVLETLGAHAAFTLVASDIDSRVLAMAAQGVYRLDGLKGLGAERLQRFFLRGKGGNAGMVRVKPELRQHIDFISVNLIHDDWPFPEPFDMVFCRNVMIYFDAPTQQRVLARIHRVLKPGGLLFVGHAENFSESRTLFALRGKTVYERR
ncbi:CheR family methyltransferase [Verminephrobacter eiseniae]|uniref:CheR family methyltransferase n=1 Tax=Verminephrobacter eiseniae TaxID=364317 RepID=UPI0010F307F3|nr:CheR family methyltransferase [Verminephrobacter eiseniae]KAB7566319.1 methyltransferase domain-containing protein [Verminephrobacter sp. Larva24]MCW5291709.1 methyltransferase domain-containing protein [Verminephrobacter eiseniae]MCW8183402.1 methyltransferase domain-containing protein [Verminephrobacter eiseniae]MCW8233481.1 methyltransferase domain-containing protein [Verminephrobacter eiseniae]